MSCKGESAAPPHQIFIKGAEKVPRCWESAEVLKKVLRCWKGAEVPKFWSANKSLLKLPNYWVCKILEEILQIGASGTFSASQKLYSALQYFFSTSAPFQHLSIFPAPQHLFQHLYWKSVRKVSGGYWEDAGKFLKSSCEGAEKVLGRCRKGAEVLKKCWGAERCWGAGPALSPLSISLFR